MMTCVASFLCAGVIYNNETIVYNRNSRIVNLVVMATDHGIDPRSTVVPVQLEIKDINNHRPLFEQTTLTESVEEDEHEGLLVASAIAHDEDDSEANGKIDYSILSGNEDAVFCIKSAGAVYLIGQLDREVTPDYRLIVQVCTQICRNKE